MSVNSFFPAVLMFLGQKALNFNSIYTENIEIIFPLPHNDNLHPHFINMS